MKAFIAGIPELPKILSFKTGVAKTIEQHASHSATKSNVCVDLGLFVWWVFVVVFFVCWFFCNCIVPLEFLSQQLRQSRAIQRTVHSGCFSVSIIHRSLTWITGSLTCAQILMHAVAHGGVGTPCESLNIDSRRKIRCRTRGEWNLCQRCASPSLLSLIHISEPTRHH